MTGHSYASSGEFSTNTRLLDLRRGRYIADLEDFTVRNDGERMEAPDFNFWGVTFERDGDSFYATLSTGSHRYLVHGSVRARRVEVLRDQVECPSLSPDGTRIAYKRTLGGGRWRPHVLDLRTGADRPLAESRSIDDQLEWAGNRFVLYGDGQDVYLVAAGQRNASPSARPRSFSDRPQIAPQVAGLCARSVVVQLASTAFPAGRPPATAERWP